MTAIRLIACLLAFSAVAEAAAEPTPTAAATTAAQIQAEAAAADFSMQLRQTLMAAISEGGPAGGVATCQVQAPRIAAEVAQAHGVSMGRVGVRVRNPGNAAQGWQGDALAAFAARSETGEAPESLRQIELSPDGSTLRMARGIRTEGACLMCHGPAVPPALEASIREHYPDDRATGFSEGSLRGLLWVEVPLRPVADGDADPRAAVTLTPAQAVALRQQMRRHLEGLQAALAGLAKQDWTAVVQAAAPAATSPQGEGSAGADFRRRLPPSWFQMARPMHQSLQLAAAEAEDAKRIEVIVAHLAEATSHCNACHSSFRIDEQPLAAARPGSGDMRSLSP